MIGSLYYPRELIFLSKLKFHCLRPPNSVVSYMFVPDFLLTLLEICKYSAFDQGRAEAVSSFEIFSQTKWIGKKNKAGYTARQSRTVGQGQ